MTTTTWPFDDESEAAADTLCGFDLIFLEVSTFFWLLAVTSSKSQWAKMKTMNAMLAPYNVSVEDLFYVTDKSFAHKVFTLNRMIK